RNSSAWPGRSQEHHDVSTSKARIVLPDFNRFILENIRSQRSFAIMQRAGGLAPIRGLQRASKTDIEAIDPTIPVYTPQSGDLEWLYSLTPRYLPDHAPDEVVGDLYLELCERTLRREDAPARVRAIVRRHNKDFPTEAYGDIRSPLSLDAPAYLDG